MIDRQQAIISSMTKAERKKPDILQASRKRRIAKGAGVDVAEINRLLKQHRQMADAFKMMSRDGGKGFARMAGMMGGGGGMGPAESHGRRQDARARSQLEEMQAPSWRPAAWAAGRNFPASAADCPPASTPSRNRLELQRTNRKC
jgi:signal recognition particle subunit SRP54